MRDSLRRLTEQDRFWIGLAVLALYAGLLIAPVFHPADPVLALLHEAAQGVREFAALVVFYYFATSKGSSDKTAMLAQAPPIVASTTDPTASS